MSDRFRALSLECPMSPEGRFRLVLRRTTSFNNRVILVLGQLPQGVRRPCAHGTGVYRDSSPELYTSKYFREITC